MVYGFMETMLKSLKQKQNSSGVTLLEVLLVLALGALIAGIGTPVYQSFQNRNNLDIAASLFVASVRRAHALSQAISDDSSWGVYVESGGGTLFRGNSYASRISGFDEFFEIPLTITPSGLSEIVFDKLTGEPQAVGTLTLTSSSNETRIITINAKGMVDF